MNLNAKRDSYLSGSRPVSELVPWVWQPGPGLVLCKDGSVGSFYRIKGVEYGSTDMKSLDMLTLQVRQALRIPDEQAMIWAFTVRRKMPPEELELPGTRSSDKITRGLQAAWNNYVESGTHYRNERYLAVLRRPPQGASTRYMDRFSGYTNAGLGLFRSALMAMRSGVDSEYQLDSELRRVETLCNELEMQGEQIADILSEVGVTRVLGDDLTTLMHSLVSPPNARQMVIQDPDCYLDTGLPDSAIDVEDRGLVFSGLNKRHAVVLTLKTWPETLLPGILDGLDSIPGELVYSAAFQFISRGEAEKSIEKYRRYHKMLSIPLKSYISQAFGKPPDGETRPQHVKAAQETEAALADLDTVSWGRLNFTIVCYGDDREEAELVARRATQVVQKVGGLVMRETMHALSAWAGTLPGQWAEPVRWALLNSNHLAALMPMRNVDVGEPENKWLKEQTGRNAPPMTVFPTHYGSVYRHHAHAEGIGHTMFVGPTGSGKSVFVNFLLTQFQRYEPTRVIIIDRDYSCQVPTLLQNGEHVDLGDEGGAIRLNPLSLLEDPNEAGWATEWVEGLMGGDGLNPDERDRLTAAIKQTADIARSSNTPGLMKLGTLYQHLDETLKLNLADWVEVAGGRYANYFDHAEDSFKLSDLIAIEMGGLLNRSPRLAKSTLDYIFRRIERSLDGRPTVIYQEEAAFMLADPRAAAKYEDWLRTFRKKNAGVWMATQSLDEMEKTSIRSVLSESIPIRIMLPNPEADKHAHLYRSFGMNDWQIQTIMHAQKNSDYYISTPAGGRTVSCRLRGDLLSAMRSDTAARKAMLNAREQGGDWQRRYFDLMRAS